MTVCVRTPEPPVRPMLFRPFLDEWIRTQLSDGDVESAGYLDQYRDAVNRPHTPLHLREPALRPAEEPS